jgi:hypothetical protein
MLLQEICHVFRMFVRSPGFTAIAGPFPCAWDQGEGDVQHG